MDTYRETIETWNKVAGLYQDKFMNLDLYNDTYDVFCKAIDVVNAKVLEIGCGPGNITRYLLNRRSDFKILGIDVAPNMIALAEKNVPAANFRVMDCRRINELEGKFDAIISGFCIPYLTETDCKKLIRDCSNLLTGAGIFYLSFVEGNPRDSGMQTGSSGDSVYFHYYSLDSLYKILADNYFEHINTLKVNYPKGSNSSEEHTIVVTRKNVVNS